KVLRPLRLGSERLAVEQRRLAVALLVVQAQDGEVELLDWTGGLSLQDLGQSLFQSEKAFAVLDPLGGGITPAVLLAAKFVPFSQSFQRLGKLTEVPEDMTQVAMGLSITWHQLDGLVVGGDGRVQLLLVTKDVAEVVVAPGIFRIECDGFAEGGDGL